MDGSSNQTDKLMRVGELAKAVGKTVRAMHLYEELGLLEPRARSEGGFRLYGPEAIDRIHWIVKLQAIGFTLAEIQGFVKDFQYAGSAPEASARVRALFLEKQQQIREQIMQLQVIENDLTEALAYLDSLPDVLDRLRADRVRRLRSPGSSQGRGAAAVRRSVEASRLPRATKDVRRARHRSLSRRKQLMSETSGVKLPHLHGQPLDDDG